MNQGTVGTMDFRPFGITRDHMDVDFDRPGRPQLVTQLIRSCTPGVSEDHVWALTVSRRIEALLHIAASGGAAALTLQLHCTGDTCGEPMEVELSREEILGMRPPGEDPPAEPIRITVDGTHYRFRKPTGNDQLSWLESSFTDEENARAAMIRTLCLDPGLPITPQWIAAVDEGMRTADPLVHFTLTVSCPACGRESVFPVDLETLLLRRLRDAQKVLFDTVHRLASHYHWSESQVLDVPPHRRSYYLTRIHGDV